GGRGAVGGVARAGADWVTAFAHGWLAGRRRGDVVGGGEGGGHGGGHGDADAGRADGGRVDVVVTHVNDLVRGEVERGGEFLKGDAFVGAALHKVGDF